jgi:hypothetical protein
MSEGIMTRDRENKGRKRCIWCSLSTLVVLIWMMGRCNIYKGARDSDMPRNEIQIQTGYKKNLLVVKITGGPVGSSCLVTCRPCWLTARTRSTGSSTGSPTIISFTLEFIFACAVKNWAQQSLQSFGWRRWWNRGQSHKQHVLA